MVRRPSGVIEHGVFEAVGGEIELRDEGIDKAHRVLRRDVVIERLGQQQHLAPVASLNVVHAGPGACQNQRQICYSKNMENAEMFSHSLALQRTRVSVTPAASSLRLSPSAQQSRPSRVSLSYFR